MVYYGVCYNRTSHYGKRQWKRINQNSSTNIIHRVFHLLFVLNYTAHAQNKSTTKEYGYNYHRCHANNIQPSWETFLEILHQVIHHLSGLLVTFGSLWYGFGRRFHHYMEIQRLFWFCHSYYCLLELSRITNYVPTSQLEDDPESWAIENFKQWNCYNKFYLNIKGFINRLAGWQCIKVTDWWPRQPPVNWNSGNNNYFI